MAKKRPQHSSTNLTGSLSIKLYPPTVKRLITCDPARYGDDETVKVETASSSPTARYANFMSILEVAGMYPGQVPVEAVIEASDITNKEAIIDRLVPVGTEVSGQTKQEGSNAGRVCRCAEGIILSYEF